MVGSDAPTPAREEGLQPYGALYCFGRRSEGGAGGRAESHPACVNGQQLCRKQFPLAGLDAPTPARIGTGRPKGRSHFSFGGERKVCKRKPAARRLQRRHTSLCTAAKPCAALGLGYALHGFQPFLALVGLRPPLVAGFGFAVPLRGVLNPRCCAPFDAARSTPCGGSCGLRTALPLRGVLVLGAAHP